MDGRATDDRVNGHPCTSVIVNRTDGIAVRLLGVGRA